MREIFVSEPKAGGLDPEPVFYVIRPEDVGHRVINTTEGNIFVGYFMGPVLKEDIGKRLYRRLDNARADYVWSLESITQMESRLLRARLDSEKS